MQHMASTVHACSPGTALYALLEAAGTRRAGVVVLRPLPQGLTSPHLAEAQFRTSGRSNAYEAYPMTPLQVMWEIAHTPPVGATPAEVLLHALRAHVQGETTVMVAAHLADGHSQWTLLYTAAGMLIAHRNDDYYC